MAIRVADIVGAIVAVALAGSILRGFFIEGSTRRTDGRTAQISPPDEPVSLDSAQTVGTANAAVAIIEFSDFQCPFCGVFARDTLPAVEQQYVATGKVLFAFRHLPLLSVHPFAMNAAVSAACAAQSGQFWAMHDSLFRHQKELQVDRVRQLVSALGLDVEGIRRCVDSSMASDTIVHDMQEAGSLSIRSTPTFLVGRILADRRVKVARVLTGAISLAAISSEVEQLLMKPAAN